MPKEITIAGQKEDETDYYITLLMPWGREVTIMVPKDLEIGQEETGEYMPYGLNLITKGHYL